MIPLTDAWTGGRPTLRSEKPLEMTIGAVSPLWFLFAGAAATGAAYWWMSQWVKPVNLEAIMGQAVKPTTPALTAPAAEPSFDEETELQAMVEPAFSAQAMKVSAEDVAETVVEAALAPAEAMEEAMEEVLAVDEPAAETATPAIKTKKAKAATPPEA